MTCVIILLLVTRGTYTNRICQIFKRNLTTETNLLFMPIPVTCKLFFIPLQVICNFSQPQRMILHLSLDFFYNIYKG
jgi:hypothetical protein